MDDQAKRQELLSLTTEIVASFAGNNAVAVADLPSIISSVYEALRSVDVAEPETTAEPPTPAVPVKKSVMPDHIVCLEDGKKLKMLKRYLRSRYKMSPDEYRARWNLAPDYPMVAPNYAARRSEFAKKIGLGKGNSAPKSKRRKA